MTKFETKFVFLVCHTHVYALIKYEVNHDCESCASDLIKSIEYVVIVTWGRKAILQVEPESEETSVDILVKEPLHKVAESYTERSAMPEQQSTKDLELWHCVIWEACSLVALFTEYSYSNVSLLNHVDIISAISYC